MRSPTSYDAVCFDLFGTLVDADGAAFPGVREALAVLPPERWTIVTSCPERVARALVRQAGLTQPGALVTADDVERTKPAPDPYRLAVERFGLAPSRALAVEDSREGLAAARAAELDSIAVLRGRGSGFARDALFLAERFADIRWFVETNGSISFEIEPSGR